MANKIVHCRVCKQAFEADPATEGTNWIMPSPRWYYHLNCYNSWRNGDCEIDEDYWVELIYDFIARDLKVSYDYWRCEAQRKKFVEQNKCTNKGIYFALKYFYEIKHNDWKKGHEGIGIVPYIYSEAAEYWVMQENLRRGTVAEIAQQVKERAERDPITIKKNRKDPKKKKWNLEEL